MKTIPFAMSFVISLLFCGLGMSQNVLDPHAGIHSGSWTLKRSQLAEIESKDPYRSCSDPYCARCAKHLADYGHEYQYISGPSQRQIWYRGTAGMIAPVTQRGYDQHGLPYSRRGRPAAVMSWEYAQVLNHAIWEQVNARNAVAAEEAAKDRVILLTQLLDDADKQLQLTKAAWEQVEHLESPCSKVNSANIQKKHCTKTLNQFSADMKAGRYETAKSGLCEYCLASHRYQFDQAYVAEVECVLASAQKNWEYRSAQATELVRIALLSKDDADKATRFKRIQYKPPKYKEVLAAKMQEESMIQEELPIVPEE